MNTNNPLAYKENLDKLPADLKVKISPSKFDKFISKHYQWYREVILKEEGFTHNTSSVIGTIVHYIAHMVAIDQPLDKPAIDEYIDSFAEGDDYSKSTVRYSFQAMANCLVNGYVLPNKANYLEVEQFKFAQIDEGYYAAGLPDVIQGTKEDCMIVDYKTYSGKTKPKSIPYNYRYQLLVYAYILKMLGYNPTRMRLVYVNRHIEGEISEKTGKQLKSYPPELTVLTEDINAENMDFIEQQLLLCVDTCEAGFKYPELTHVIWHDMRLVGDTL